MSEINIIRSTRPNLDPRYILVGKVGTENLLLSHITFNMTPEIHELFNEYSDDIDALNDSITGTDSVTVTLTEKDELYAKINGYTKTLRFYNYNAISTDTSSVYSFGFKTNKEKHIDNDGYYVGLVTTLKDDKTKMGSLPKFNGKVGLLESIGLISDIFKNSDIGYLSFNNDNTRKFELAPVVNNTLNRNYIISGKNISEVQERKANTLKWFKNIWDVNVLDISNYDTSVNYQNEYMYKTFPDSELTITNGYLPARPFYFLKCNDIDINNIEINIIVRCIPVTMIKKTLSPGQYIFSYPEWVMNRKEIIECIQPNAYITNSDKIIAIYDTNRDSFGLDVKEGSTPYLVSSDKTNYNLIANCNLIRYLNEGGN